MLTNEVIHRPYRRQSYFSVSRVPITILLAAVPLVSIPISRTLPSIAVAALMAKVAAIVVIVVAYVGVS